MVRAKFILKKTHNGATFIYTQWTTIYKETRMIASTYCFCMKSLNNEPSFTGT